MASLSEPPKVSTIVRRTPSRVARTDVLCKDALRAGNGESKGVPQAGTDLSVEPTDGRKTSLWLVRPVILNQLSKARLPKNRESERIRTGKGLA